MFTLAVILMFHKSYTFNSTVNFAIVSKMFQMIENINKSNFIANYPKENTLSLQVVLGTLVSAVANLKEKPTEVKTVGNIPKG